MPSSPSPPDEGFRARVRDCPDEVALWDAFGAPLATFAELDRQVAEFAAALASLSLPRDSALVVLTANRREAYVAYLAALRAGITVMLLDGSLPFDELRAALHLAHAPVVVAEAQYAQSLDDAARPIRLITVIDTDSSEAPDNTAPLDELLTRTGERIDNCDAECTDGDDCTVDGARGVVDTGDPRHIGVITWENGARVGRTRRGELVPRALREVAALGREPRDAVTSFTADRPFSPSADLVDWRVAAGWLAALGTPVRIVTDPTQLDGAAGLARASLWS